MAISDGELRRDVGMLLDMPPDCLSDDADLLLLGLDSIRVMSVVNTFQARGVTATFAELMDEPTLGAWQAITAARRPGTVPAAAVAVEVDEDAPFELTPIQHAYWIGRQDGQLLGGVGCHFYAEFDGRAVEPARLERAVLALVARHDLLRARFVEDGTQQIMPHSPWRELPVHDLRADEAEDSALAKLRAELSHRRLEVERGAVFDIVLSLLPEGRTRVHVSVDLLVADVRSIQILLHELAAIYTRPDAPRAPIAFSFAKYRHEQLIAREDEHRRGRTYWQARLATLPGGPQLPLATEPERVRRPVFSRRDFVLPTTDWQRFADRARQQGVTPAMALATAFTEILTAWSADPRFLLGLPTFDRRASHPAVNELVADFTTLILLEVDGCGEYSFAARASRLQARFRADLDHSAYSGVEVLRDLDRARPGEGLSAPVVFACNLGGGDLVGADFRRAIGVPGWGVSQTPQVWLDHQVMEVDEGLFLNWDAVDELFPAGLVDCMFEAYRQLLTRLSCSDWTQPIGDLLPAAQQLTRAVVNRTQAPESGQLLHEEFFARATRTPERVALILADGQQWIYRELAESAHRIAGLLTSCGVRPGDAVGVTLPKGPEQIAAVLGVLWAGGVYVPVGTDQPRDRCTRIYAKAGVQVVLTNGAASEWSPTLRVVDVAAAATPLTNPTRVSVDSLAYVIFTSGSSGEPKGVEISHRAVVNTIEAINVRFDVTESDRVLAVSALDFDLSVYDIFGLLSVGGTVVLIEDEDRREARRWLELVRRHGVTVWNSVPALLDMLLVVGDDGDRGLRLALVSGDWIGLDLPGRLVERWPACQLIALGGATEASIWSNYFPVAEVAPEWSSIPYGYPLSNQCFRVVDARGRDCPDGVTGELWIGGTGIARGYRGDPEITARQFVQVDGCGWYRTGDLGRYGSDGALEFLGRIDQQVKIRGHRIELGEIEAALQCHPLIDNVVAVATGERSKRLAAVVITASVTTEQARAWLAERVPAYMVPDRIVVLAEAPLTANGKVDRKAILGLLAASAPVERRTIDPPDGTVETTTAAVWSELLDLEKVGRNQSFFALGGDSLLATRSVTRLHALGIRGAELRTLFAKPVLADFAATLTDTGRTRAPATALRADPAQRYTPFPATDIQRAYWIGRTEAFVLGGIGSHFYTEFDGPDIDLARVEQAWNVLIDRHEMLRAVFDDDGHQRILAAVPRFVIDTVHADGPGESALNALRDNMSHQVLDPGRWPLFDVRAVRYGDGRVRMGVSLDNLILDALSVMILYSELGRLYEELDCRLPDIELSFRDYVVSAGPEPTAIEASQQYWRDRLADLPPAPQLPLRSDPALISRPRFVRHEASLDAASWRALTEQARRNDLTPSAILLTCYAEVLARWSAAPELTLNLTVFDRREVHPHIDRVLGDFTSLFLVAYRPVPGEGWLATARRLQEQMWLDLDHAGVSAVWVLRELAKQLGVSDVAMPVVFTSALGITKAVARPLDLPFAERIWGISQTPQVWLDHQVMEIDGGLVLNWDAVDGLFPPGMVDEMLVAYRELLQARASADWSDSSAATYECVDGSPGTAVSRRGTDDGGLGEIEAALERHPLIAQAAATIIGPRSQRRIGAVLRCVRSAQPPSTASELRGSATGRLRESACGTTPSADADEFRLVEWVLACLLNTELGFSGRDRVQSADELPVADELRPAFATWLDWLESRDVLGDREHIRTEGARWLEASAAPRFTGPAVARDRYEKLAEALSGCLPLLGAVLRGERDPLVLLTDEVLAPDALIDDDPPTVSNIDEIARQIAELARLLGRPVRVAELGARSGRTADRLLGALLPHEVEYTLLETSATLLRMAQHRTAHHPHEVDGVRMTDDGVSAELFQHFDVVVANNALHRFDDVDAGLALTRLLVAPGGLLLAVESTVRSPLALLSAALLTHGFTAGVDSADREPLLGAAQWLEALRRTRWDATHVVSTGSSVLLRAVQPLRTAAPSLDDVRRSLTERLPAHMVPELLAVVAADDKLDRDTARRLFAVHDGQSDEDGDAPEGEIECLVAAIWIELLAVSRVGRHQSFFSLGGDSVLATRLVEQTRRTLSADLSLRRLFTAPTIAGMAVLIAEQRVLVDVGAIEDEVL
ncbi:amino acid adenylation domain-containing protein [Nocardia sp. NPDC050175]|uniref:amino acid adenylation domain-containing protein n=1 Tax=Nocardia sp. NPDC050175 TaxID=3364317 RepID=UPI00378992DC